MFFRLRKPTRHFFTLHFYKREMELIKKVHQDIYGNGQLFDTPFEKRQITYADFTASGKSLKCIEDYIAQQVLPLYANTHTTTSVTGRQSTSFREEARKIIAEAVNADPEKDSVLFCGAGCTGAISKLITALGLNKTTKERAVVFVGPFEHHSNILPWKETSAEVVMVPEGSNNQVDLQRLEELLIEYRSRSIKIGTFSAASNITGFQSDTNSIATLLHKHGALSFWDYASAAPYVAMDMNPSENKKYAYKDAIFFSGHKFIGGPGSPGVLVVKNKLLEQSVPTQPGGGTVLFVTDEEHRYLKDKVERNEGGTPDILGSIRLGLAFQLKQKIGTELIEERETSNTRFVVSELGKNPNIVLLGPNSETKLPIISFMIKYQGRFLDYNLVCTLLNDLFGMQTRGGCQCAGPYAQRILGISTNNSRRIRRALVGSKDPTVKPGFTRLSFPYFLTTQDVEFMVKCIDFVGTHGWKFLRLYQFQYETGAWTHPSRGSTFVGQKCLSSYDFFSLPEEDKTTTQDLRTSYLDEAHQLVQNYMSWTNIGSASAKKCIKYQRDLRWVAFATDADAALPNPSKQIVDPSRYHQTRDRTSSKPRIWGGKKFLKKLVPKVFRKPVERPEAYVTEEVPITCA